MFAVGLAGDIPFPSVFADGCFTDSTGARATATRYDGDGTIVVAVTRGRIRVDRVYSVVIHSRLCKPFAVPGDTGSRIAFLDAAAGCFDASIIRGNRSIGRYIFLVMGQI